MRSKRFPLRLRASSLGFAFLLLTAARAGANGGLTLQAVDQAAQPVTDLVVWLEPLDAPAPPAAEPGSIKAVVEQKNEEFKPYVIVVRTGTRVFFPNRDDVQHHVYSLSQPARFEIPLHGGEDTESVVMEHPGLVPIGCNIHDWMLSYIVVVDTPWFTQTTTAGTATLNDLPPGRYHLTAWNPRLRANHEEVITVAEGPATAVSLKLRLRPDRRIRRAPDAGGSGY